jgi:hypothetical protein
VTGGAPREVESPTSVTMGRGGDRGGSARGGHGGARCGVMSGRARECRGGADKCYGGACRRDRGAPRTLEEEEARLL